MNKKAVASLMAVTLAMVSQSVTFGSGQAVNAVYSTAYTTVTSNTYAADGIKTVANDKKELQLTLARAVYLGLQNNRDLLALNIDIEFRELDQDKANYYSDQQRDADDQIKDGWKQLGEARAQLDQIPDGTVLPAGTRLPDGTVLSAPTPKAALVAQLDAKQQELEAASKYSIDTLAEAQVAELIEEKARIGLAVTQLGQKVAEQKIAVGVQKAYYDALKAKYLVAVKEKAYNRVQAQAKMAKEAHNAGMRAKDDLLMVQAQAQLMKADWEKAQGDYEVAMLELKQTMGISPGQYIQLKDDFSTQGIQPDLTKDISKALSKRLEIRKVQGELDIHSLNAELAERYTSGVTFETREARLNVRKAENELAKQKLVVETEVRKSHATLLVTQNMLQYIEQAQAQAQESMEIATLRYKEGYVFASGVLKNLHAEDSAGTIIEVLAAEEKLAEIEEKSVSIIYGYNLARSKYLLDIGQGL